MRAHLTILLLWSVGACTTTDTSSLGDSPLHDISCPTYLEWEMCVAKGKRLCEGGDYRLISPSAEELEESKTQGRTVPIEGQIRYRTITIMCNQ